MSLHSNAAKEKFDISTHTRRSKFYAPQHDQNYATSYRLNGYKKIFI